MQQNLLTYSEQFDNAAWIKNSTTITVNATTAPDGTQNADKIVESLATVAHNVQQINVGLPLTTYTYSFFAKAAERNRIAVWLRGTSSTNRYDVGFNLTNGSVFGGTLSGNFTSPSATITTVGNGWYRCVVTATTGAGETAIQVLTYLLDAVQPPNNAAYEGNGTSGAFIYGAQLNIGSSPLPYAVTTTTPYALCEAEGLLIEGQRTNLATYSNTFSDASWVAVGTKTVVASAVLSPEGIANAWTLTDSSAVAFDGIQKTVTVANDAAAYTFSIFIAKTSGGTSNTFGINLAISGGTLVSNNARINTDLGTVLIGTATVTSVGAWWRVSVPITNNTSGNTSLVVQLYPATNTYNLSASVAATTGSATIYGAQIEAGNFITSYIPTVASQITRAADNASIDTLAPWYNAVQGSLYVEFSCPAYDILNYPAAAQLGVKLGGSRGYIHVVNGPAATTVFNIFDDTPAYQGVTPSPAYVTGTVRKQIGAYAANNSAASIAASAATTDTTVTLPTGLNCLAIGSYTSLTSNRDGVLHVRQIKYYPTRLPNATLQKLTT